MTLHKISKKFHFLALQAAKSRQYYHTGVGNKQLMQRDTAQLKYLGQISAPTTHPQFCIMLTKLSCGRS